MKEIELLYKKTIKTQAKLHTGHSSRYHVRIRHASRGCNIDFAQRKKTLCYTLYSKNSILYLGVRKGKHAHFAPRMRNPRIQSVEPATLAICGTNFCIYPLIYSSTLQLTPNPRLASCSIPHRMPCCLARQLIFSLCPIPCSIFFKPLKFTRRLGFEFHLLKPFCFCAIFPDEKLLLLMLCALSNRRRPFHIIRKLA